MNSIEKKGGFLILFAWKKNVEGVLIRYCMVSASILFEEGKLFQNSVHRAEEENGFSILMLKVQPVAL